MLHWQEGLTTLEMSGILSKVWRLWSKALGQKEGRTDGEANTIALIRTVLILQTFITNFYIIGNAVRHWNNTGTAVYVCVDKPNDGYYCSHR